MTGRSRKPQALRMNNPIVPIEDIDDASKDVRMLHDKITDRQHELVASILHDGRTITFAASEMGADRVWASKTLNKQHVIDYMHDLAKRSLGVHSIRALATMGNLLSAKSEKVRQEAAKDLLDRAGVGAESSSSQTSPLVINISL